jgi:hypothetical protein
MLFIPIGLFDATREYCMPYTLLLRSRFTVRILIRSDSTSTYFTLLQANDGGERCAHHLPLGHRGAPFGARRQGKARSGASRSCLSPTRSHLHSLTFTPISYLSQPPHLFFTSHNSGSRPLHPKRY